MPVMLTFVLTVLRSTYIAAASRSTGGATRGRACHFEANTFFLNSLSCLLAVGCWPKCGVIVGHECGRNTPLTDLHRRSGFPLLLPPFLGLPLVVELLAADHGDLALHPPSLEV